MTSVYFHVKQGIQFGEGSVAGFDLARIEAEIRDALLPSAHPVALLTRDFNFKNELKFTGALEMMCQRMRQESLSAPVLEQLWAELDTKYRLELLVHQLDDCISFIGGLSAGGGGSGGAGGAGAASNIEGATKFSSFVLEVLQISPHKWAEMATPLLTSTVCLHHLRCLVQFIEEKQVGAFASLDDKYKYKLSAEQETQLSAAIACMDCVPALSEALNNLLVKLCDRGANFFPTLKDNLPYYCNSDEEEDSLEDNETFNKHFPDELTVDFALEAHLLVKAAL
jgi:hypothetical protein